MSGKVTGGNILFSINSIQKACSPRIWVLNYLVNILKNYQTNSKCYNEENLYFFKSGTIGSFKNIKHTQALQKRKIVYFIRNTENITHVTY